MVGATVNLCGEGRSISSSPHDVHMVGRLIYPCQLESSRELGDVWWRVFSFSFHILLFKNFIVDMTKLRWKISIKTLTEKQTDDQLYAKTQVPNFNHYYKFRFQYQTNTETQRKFRCIDPYKSHNFYILFFLKKCMFK